MNPPKSQHGFTLIELLTVIAIIAVLMGLLFSAMRGVSDAGNKTKAKNDAVQIVNAVKAYYMEYGKYPLPSTASGEDSTYAGNNVDLFNVLRGAMDDPMNPRKIVFLEVPAVKNTTAPKSGIGGDGKFYDPWGMPYSIRIDADYNNKVSNPYSANAGFSLIDTGVIAYSSGKDRLGTSGDKNAGQASDDVVSWQ